MTILEEFERLGDSASFHYADDTCKEWGQAQSAEKKAVALYHAHPELKEEMKELARGFLWSLPKEKAA